MKSRKRARRSRLDRDRIIDTTLSLLDRNGVAWFSMRKLAIELGVAPMSLYTHIESKDDLFDGVLLRILDGIAIEFPEDASWTEQTASVMHSLHRQLRVHPAAVSFLGSPRRIAPALLRVGERVLGILCEAGLDHRDAVLACRIVLWATVSFVLLEERVTDIPDTIDDLSARAVEPLFEDLSFRTSDEGIPFSLEHLPLLRTQTPDDLFDAYVDSLVTGLAERFERVPYREAATARLDVTREDSEDRLA